jgi:hypothetical protein
MPVIDVPLVSGAANAMAGSSDKRIAHRNLDYLHIHRTLSFVSAAARSSPAHFRARGFSFDHLPPKSTGAHTWRFDSHEKWNKETFKDTLVDLRTGSRAEDTRS